MSVAQSFKGIYNGPFTQYLRTSEKIGGLIYEQSKLVDVLFLLQLNLIDISLKYKKPIHDQEEKVFFDPINKQIEKIKKFRIENNQSPLVHHLILISQSIEIFRWIKQTNMAEVLSAFNKNIQPFIDEIRSTLLKLSMTHADWLYAWNCCLEDLTSFLSSFYKNGLTWVGTEKLPEKIILGDTSTGYKNTEHLKLFEQINQGENITSMLRQTTTENDVPETDIE